MTYKTKETVCCYSGSSLGIYTEIVSIEQRIVSKVVKEGSKHIEIPNDLYSSLFLLI
jgi:hypothetical protein